MKPKLILLYLLFQNSLLFAQKGLIPYNENTNLFSYEEVLEIPNVSKNELFYRANSWVSKYYKSSKYVVEYSDKEDGKIIIKPAIPVELKTLGMVYEVGYWKFSISILVKDSKYKYIITDFFEKSFDEKKYQSLGSLEEAYDNAKGGFLYPTQNQSKKIIETLHVEVNDLIKNLKQSMNTKSESDF